MLNCLHLMSPAAQVQTCHYRKRAVRFIFAPDCYLQEPKNVTLKNYQFTVTDMLNKFQ